MTDPSSGADVVAVLERSVVVAAPIERVWPLVSDPRRLVAWSPTLVGTRMRADEPGLEVAFTNRNRDGDLEWTTHGVITRFEEPRAIAFRIEENWAVWSFVLEPHADGTLLTHRREVPEGVSPLSQELTDGFMGGQARFTETLLRGMEATLAQVAAAAERSGADVVDLAEKFGLFSEHWSPKVVATVNDYEVRLARLQGEFVWHTHDETDELFLVVEGELVLQLRDRDVVLGAGQMFVVPRGVEHCPRADGEVKLLMLEPTGVLNTGDAGGELYRRDRADLTRAAAVSSRSR